MSLKSNIITAIVDVRIWLSYSQTWLSVATAGMVLYLFLSDLNQTFGWVDNWGLIAIPLYLTIMLLMAFWGWFCEKFGIYAADSERQWIKSRNPHIDRIHEGLARVERKLEEMEKRQKDG